MLPRVSPVSNLIADQRPLCGVRVQQFNLRRASFPIEHTVSDFRVEDLRTTDVPDSLSRIRIRVYFEV